MRVYYNQPSQQNIVLGPILLCYHMSMLRLIIYASEHVARLILVNVACTTTIFSAKIAQALCILAMNIMDCKWEA
jgi:hypothetical protein